MSDSDEKLLALYDIARERNIMVTYDRLPYKDSFITKHNGKSYIYLDTKLRGIEEVERLTHETGHDFCGISDKYTPGWLDDIYEKRAWTWAATYLVSYAKYKEVMLDPFVDSDVEAAAKCNVSLKILHKARKYYQSIRLPTTKAELEFVHRKKFPFKIATEKSYLIQHDISKTEEPPAYHLPIRIDRTQRPNRYNIKRLKYKDYVIVMRQPNIICDAETAEELNISIEFLRRARYRFRKKGLPIRQCELNTDWRNWYY